MERYSSILVLSIAFKGVVKADSISFLSGFYVCSTMNGNGPIKKHKTQEPPRSSSDNMPKVHYLCMKKENYGTWT